MLCSWKYSRPLVKRPAVHWELDPGTETLLLSLTETHASWIYFPRCRQACNYATYGQLNHLSLLHFFARSKRTVNN
jgi:hypothetical protein